jgi:hypothetical protein
VAKTKLTQVVMILEGMSEAWNFSWIKLSMLANSDFFISTDLLGISLYSHRNSFADEFLVQDGLIL